MVRGLVRGGLLAAALFTGLAGPGALAQEAEVSVLTGGSAGVFYVLGAGMSEIINRHSEALYATAEATSATVENIRLINQNQGEFAFVINDALYYAYNGGREFEADGKYENLRTVVFGHLGVWQIAVDAGSGIENFEGLRGKRIAHLPGTTGQLLTEVALQAHGVQTSDVTLVPLSLAEGVEAMKDGNVDAVSAAGGVPISGLLDLATSTNVRFLGLTPPALEQVAKDHPYFSVVDIPAGSYPGQDAAVRTYALQYALMTNKDVPDDVVADFVRVLLSHPDELVAIHPDGKWYGPDNPAYATPALTPWHPGAEAALRELGALK